MEALVFLNSKARRARADARFLQHLEAIFSSAGIEAEMHEFTASKPDQIVRESGAEVIVAAGGDGTISSIAGVAFREGRALGVLPLGTHNHFARDLGIPLELAAAAAVLAGDRRRQIDVGEVNGRVFINNASVGAYPRAVVQREELRERWRLRKMAAMFIALLRVFSRAPLLEARLELNGQAVSCRSPFIFVGNNMYNPAATAGRFRTQLDQGRLCIFTASCEGLGGFLRLLWMSFRGTLIYSRDFQMHEAETATIHLRQPRPRVSADGEVWRSENPLRFRIHKEALKVIVP